MKPAPTEIGIGPAGSDIIGPMSLIPGKTMLLFI